MREYKRDGAGKFAFTDGGGKSTPSVAQADTGARAAVRPDSHAGTPATPRANPNMHQDAFRAAWAGPDLGTRGHHKMAKELIGAAKAARAAGQHHKAFELGAQAEAHRQIARGNQGPRIPGIDYGSLPVRRGRSRN